MLKKTNRILKLIVGSALITAGLLINVNNAFADGDDCDWNPADHYCVYYEVLETGLCHAGGTLSCQEDGDIIIIIEEN